MTPTQIETGARQLMNAVGSKFWSQDEIIGTYLYMSALEMATETHCLENRYTTTSVADQREYAVPSRMASIKRVTFDGVPLKIITFRQLDQMDLNQSVAVTGTPQYYYYFDDAFGLYPTPETAGLDIDIQSYDQPDVPTATSTLEIPSAFHGYLVIGTTYYMSLKELGHPNVSRFEFMWNGSNNRNNCIKKAQRSMRMRNKDQLHHVVREEHQPSNFIGMV